jgi:DNA (cytosine-5)-methyltransferase 1
MPSEPLRLLDLFSGIGAFSLGLERSGGFKTVAFCEIEPFPRRVLRKHWPDTPIYEDVRELTAVRLAADGIAVDAICGGFPCQDVSIAGRGSGIDGERTGLWRHAMRLISELRPRVVILENVSKLRSRGLETLLGALSEIRYDAEWHCIPAAHVGAPHRRDRLWIIAHREGDAFRSYADFIRPHPPQLHLGGGAELRDEQERVPGSLAWWGSEPDVERVVNGAPSKLDVARLKAIGNSVVPQIPELIGQAILAAHREPTP